MKDMYDLGEYLGATAGSSRWRCRSVEGVKNYNICVCFDKMFVSYYKMCVVL